MPVKTKKPRFADFPADYVGLVRMFPPREIHDKHDASNVEEIVLEMAGHDLNADQDDYLSLLTDVLEKWQASDQEVRRDRLRARPVVERLNYLLEQSGTSRRDLEKLLGCTHALISMILSGERGLSKEIIAKLATHFRVSADYFL